MLAVVHAVVREKKKGTSCMTVWDVFHVLLGENLKSLKTKLKKN